MSTNYEYLREELELEAIDKDLDKELPRHAEEMAELEDDYLAEFCGYDHFFDFIYQYSHNKAINPLEWLGE